MNEQEQRIAVRCPVWHRPYLQVVPDGVEVRCGSCPKTSHRISRETLEKLWDELAKPDIVLLHTHTL